MRVNVDSKAMKDPRFKRLGKALGVSWHEALGLCVEVWMYAYEQRSEFMKTEDVDAVVARDGFGAAMLKAELAEVDRDRLRLRGVKKRIGYLTRQQESARAGGRASAASRRAKKSQGLEANAQASVNQHPKRHTTDLDLDQDHDLVPDQDPDLVLVPPEPQSSNASRSRARRAGEVTQANAVIAAFCDRYKSKYGQPPTVKAKDAGGIRVLMAKHGRTLADLQRAIANLFDAPPPFLASSPPDLGTLVQHYDKLIAPSAPRATAVMNGAGRAQPGNVAAFAADAAKGAHPWD
jgi:hypothetical protein